MTTTRSGPWTLRPPRFALSVGRAFRLSALLACPLLGAGVPTAASSDDATEQFGANVALLGASGPAGEQILLVGAPGFDDVVRGGGAVRMIPLGMSSPPITMQGTTESASFGQALLRLGDIDGDGFDDFAASAPHYQHVQLYMPGEYEAIKLEQEGGPKAPHAGHEGFRGKVMVFSGRMHWLLRLYIGNHCGDLGETLANAGDLDGDGKDDILAGAPDCSMVHPYQGTVTALSSGLPGKVLYEIRGDRERLHLGMAIVSLGTDLDGDGVLDFAAGGSPTGPGEVWLCSGKSGRVLRRIIAPGQEVGFGEAVALLPRPGGNRKDPHLAIGAPRADLAGCLKAGVVFVVSVATGQVVQRSSGTRPGDTHGQALVAIPDVDGDGWAEICVGVPGFLDASNLHVGGVRLVSGGTGKVLWEVPGPGPEKWAWLEQCLAACGDRDGDGVDDVLVGLKGSNAVWVLSGKSGKKLQAWSWQ